MVLLEAYIKFVSKVKRNLYKYVNDIVLYDLGSYIVLGRIKLLYSHSGYDNHKLYPIMVYPNYLNDYDKYYIDICKDKIATRSFNFWYFEVNPPTLRFIYKKSVLKDLPIAVQIDIISTIASYEYESEIPKDWP